MEKEFVLYPEALELMQLGFAEDSFRYYKNNFKLSRLGSFYKDDWLPNVAPELKSDFLCLAPIYSQAFRWFRQNGYRFNIVNDSENINGYYYYDVWYNGQFMFESHYIYSTYEEAELACLRKLIELFKNK